MSADGDAEAATGTADKAASAEHLPDQDTHTSTPIDGSSAADVPGTNQQESLPRSASRVPRPNSAQVACLIEGYDDDFLDDQDGAAELYPEPEVCRLNKSSSVYVVTVAAPPNTCMQEIEPLKDSEEVISGQEPDKAVGPSAAELEKRLAIAQEQQDTLLAANERLQRSIRSVLDLRRRGAAEDDSKLGTAEARYQSLAASLEEQKSKLTSSAAKYDRTVEDLREELHERLTRTTQVQNVRLSYSGQHVQACTVASAYTKTSCLQSL